MISLAKNLQLQELTINDQPKLFKLLERIYPPAYKHLWINEDCSFYLNKFYSPENLELELSDANSRYYFVIYNSGLVGILRFVYNYPFDNFPKKKSTYVNRIYLGEEAQGKGVAKQLFNWTEQKAMQNGNTLIWLKAMDSQKQALRFYEKQGYSYSGKTKLDFKLLQPSLRGMEMMYKHLI